MGQIVTMSIHGRIVAQIEREREDLQTEEAEIEAGRKKALADYDAAVHKLELRTAALKQKAKALDRLEARTMCSGASGYAARATS